MPPLQRHVDLGRAAFKALADEKWGVIGLRWRFVDCSRLGGSPATIAPRPKPVSPPSTPALPMPAAPSTTGTPAPSAAGKAGNSRPAVPPAAAPATGTPAADQPSQRAANAPKGSRAQPSWVRYAQRYAGLGGDGGGGGGYASAIQGLVDRWAGRYMQGAV
jgi:rare lipoprotein A (peptidoglycan hydrolase)